MPRPEAAAVGGVSARTDGSVLSISLSSRARRLVAVGVILTAATGAGVWVAAPAVAERLARRPPTLDRLEAAVAWDRRDPDLHLRLGLAYLARLDAGDLARARRELEIALVERPGHARTWLALAYLSEQEGGARARARATADRAVRLDSHDSGLRWEAALLALRWGDRESAFRHLGHVLAVDRWRRGSALAVALALLPPGDLVTTLLPQDPEVLAEILHSAALSGDLALAAATWNARMRFSEPVPVGTVRDYVEALLTAREWVTARRVWSAQGPRFTGEAGLTRSSPGGNFGLATANRAPEDAAAAGDAVWNSGFEGEAFVPWGFGWRIERSSAVDVELDRFVVAGGRQSLRLSFRGLPSLDWGGVVQNVVVEPGRLYHLRAHAHALDFATRSGVKLQLIAAEGDRVLAETPAVMGSTTGWVVLEARVRIPGDTTRARVRLRRAGAPGPEGNLGGHVWIDDVSLTPARQDAA